MDRLYGFNNEEALPKGKVSLPVTIGEVLFRSTKMIDFVVVDLSSEYKVLLGRPRTSAFHAVPSSAYQCMKFVCGSEVGVVRGDQQSARKCY